MAKRTSPKKAMPIRETITNDQMVDVLLQIPELVDYFTRESFTRADIELAIDDRGWITPGRNWTAADLDSQTRTTIVAKARLYWLRDPLAKQAVRVWTDYALGDGMTYSAELPEIQDRLTEFCRHRRNRSILDSEGQRKSSKKLLVDGDIFFAIFTAEEPMEIRHIDPLQITDIICDPDDDERVLGYRRLTGKGKVLFYVDWRCNEDDVALLLQQRDPQTKGQITVEKDVVIKHIAFDSLLKRGNSLLSCVVDWSKEHRRFMESRVAITQALAKFAYKTTVKGGPAVLAAVKKRMESSYVTSGAQTIERNPQPAPGSTFWQNQGVDILPMPRATGGAEAADDGNALKLMVAAGTGVMLHYFGDPSTGNLATATAMELPMLKMFGSYQKLWLDAYRDIFSIVLEEGEGMEEALIDIDLPPILASDLQKIGQFMAQILPLFPEMKVPEIVQMLLTSLGINNVSEIMKSIEDKREEIDAKNEKNQAAMLAASPAQPAAPGSPGSPAGKPTVVPQAVVPPAPAKESEVAQLAAAINQLAEAMG
jgi:hypothetical protein